MESEVYSYILADITLSSLIESESSSVFLERMRRSVKKLPRITGENGDSAVYITAIDEKPAKISLLIRGELKNRTQRKTKKEFKNFLEALVKIENCLMCRVSCSFEEFKNWEDNL